MLGIIGPNGAGKTTLFDVISGVREPNEGRVVLAGNDVTSKSAVQRARRGLRRTFQRVQTFGWLYGGGQRPCRHGVARRRRRLPRRPGRVADTASA